MSRLAEEFSVARVMTGFLGRKCGTTQHAVWERGWKTSALANIDCMP